MQRPLNALDLAMLGMHESIQNNGSAGFEELSMFWLEDRLDVTRFRAGLDQLSARHPWLAGTLRRDWKGTRVWRWNGSSKLPCIEQTLESSDRALIHTIAEQLISKPRDLTREPGFAFHLLHLSDGSDVLMVQVNHALMDHPCATLVLQDLNRILRGETLPPALPFRDLVRDYRKRFTLAQRWRSVRILTSDRRAMNRRRPPRMLSELKPSQPMPSHDSMAIITRVWDEEQTRRFLEVQRGLARLSSESMTILGSAFRAMSDMIPNPADDDLYRSHIGVDLGMITPRRLIPQNGFSILRVQAQANDLRDRAQRVRLFGERLLGMLKVQRDLAMSEMMSLIGHNCYPMLRKSGRRLTEKSFSLFYAFFVVPADLSEEFGGVRVRHISNIAPAWAPMGLALLVSRFRGRMEFQATYLPRLIDRATVEEFLDRTLRELEETMRELLAA